MLEYAKVRSTSEEVFLPILQRFWPTPLIFSFCLLHAADLQRIPTKLGNRTLELGLLRLSDRKLIPWPDDTARLATESAPAGPELNVSARLAGNGIEPDVGAYALFYELNPQVTKVAAIPPDAKVVLPKILAGAKLSPILTDGSHLVVLLLDSDIRSELNDQSSRLQTTGQAFGQLPASRFNSAEEQSVVVKQVQDLTRWYEHIARTGRQRKGPPLSRETLQQLRDEAVALSALTKPYINGQTKFATEDRAQLDAIHQDVEREIRRYDDVLSAVVPDPDLTACCSVVVAIRGDPNVVDQLRVYYTLNGLFRNPPPGPIPGSTAFTELGSGKSVTLRAKNYKFWAAREGDPDRLITQPVMAPLQPTTDKQPTRVELVVLPLKPNSTPKR